MFCPQKLNLRTSPWSAVKVLKTKKEESEDEDGEEDNNDDDDNDDDYHIEIVENHSHAFKLLLPTCYYLKLSVTLTVVNNLVKKRWKSRNNI